jgi:Histidine kinase-, DNA gyrase B-, and HSP90-like ATPase
MSRTLASQKGVATAWRHTNSPLTIGKDLLELLSNSMYVDSMAIYREYIQNAIDAVDEARQAGLLAPTDTGKVEIFLDVNNRTILIRDNGCGIERDEFEERLSAFGASSKRGTQARGFRGVGRLAGLAYCQELIFRSSASGESDVHEMRWDCRNIKAILRTTESVSSLENLVNSVASIRDVDAKGWPDHFFEVELRGIIRHKNDSLLNNVAVYDYLSEVAPVPFSPDFMFGEEIVSALSEHISFGNLDIRIEGVNRSVYRPHRNDLQARGGIHDSFTDLEVHLIPGTDSQVGAIAWILHHGYKGAIPISQIRGLRLRSGNIQVGGYDLLQDLFPEPRFNSWAVGEIHTIDKRIIPNGRRDHYEQNVHFSHLTNHISPIARQISARCRQSSVLRNHLQDFHRRETLVREKLQTIRQGGLSSKEREKQIQDIDEIINVMRRIISRDSFAADVQTLKSAIGLLEKEFARLKRYKRIAKPLKQLSPKERQAYERVISLIYECSQSTT